jgi:ligand-binding sensor domain-containing protein
MREMISGNRMVIRVNTLPAMLLLLCVLSLAACTSGSSILGGGDWQVSGLQHQPIRTLEVNPKDPQKLYAGDAEGNIFVSADAGQRWIEQNKGISLPNAIHVLAFTIAGTKLYAATDTGLFVSTDEAQHWNAVSTLTSGLPADSYTAITFDVNTQHTVYVGTMHHGVFSSTNDGAQWSSANTGLPLHTEVYSLALDTDNHQLWAATSLGVYRSDNRNIAWQAFNNGLPATIVVNAVVPAAASGGMQGLVYAGTNHGVFRSLNDGEDWTTNSESLSGTSIHTILVDFRSSNASTVYVGTDVGVFRSEDNGQDWGGTASSLPRGKPVYALVVGANNYTQLYAAVDSVGIYLFPGTSGGIDPSRLLPFVVVVFFFFLLYRLTWRGRRRRQALLKPERITETRPPES